MISPPTHLRHCVRVSQSEWEGAIYHFEQMLSKQPNNYHAVAKLLQLLNRAGRMARRDGE